LRVITLRRFNGHGLAGVLVAGIGGRVGGGGRIDPRALQGEARDVGSASGIWPAASRAGRASVRVSVMACAWPCGLQV
jgi:hypothetical protein